MASDEYFSLLEAAEYLGKNFRTVSLYIRQGKLTKFKIMGRVYLRKEEVYKLSTPQKVS